MKIQCRECHSEAYIIRYNLNTAQLIIQCVDCKSYINIVLDRSMIVYIVNNNKLQPREDTFECIIDFLNKEQVKLIINNSL